MPAAWVVMQEIPQQGSRWCAATITSGTGLMPAAAAASARAMRTSAGVAVQEALHGQDGKALVRPVDQPAAVTLHGGRGEVGQLGEGHRALLGERVGERAETGAEDDRDRRRFQWNAQPPASNTRTLE